MTFEPVKVRAHIRRARKPKASKKLPFFTKLPPDLLVALKGYKKATGMPEAVQVALALRAWFADRPEAWPRPTRAKGGTKKTAR